MNFEERKLALKQNRRENKRTMSFATQYQQSVPNFKEIILKKWHLIKKQPLLADIYKEAPLTSYKKGRSLKRYTLENNVMRAAKARVWESCSLVTPILHHCIVLESVFDTSSQ